MINREETIRMNKMKQKIESFYQRYCDASAYGITERIRKNYDGLLQSSLDLPLSKESFGRLDSLRDIIYDNLKNRRKQGK